MIMRINFFQNKNTTIYSVKINNKHYILWFSDLVEIVKPELNTFRNTIISDFINIIFSNFFRFRCGDFSIDLEEVNGRKNLL